MICRLKILKVVINNNVNKVMYFFIFAFSYVAMIVRSIFRDSSQT